MLLFWITLVLFIIVLSVGNYLYFNRVLPAINKTSEIMPREQGKQIENYLNTLAAEQSKGLAYVFLKYYQHIQSLMGLLLICNIIYMSVF